VKRVVAADLRAELEFLLTHDASAPDWSNHELTMILRRFDKAVSNVVHHRGHAIPEGIEGIEVY
jgi:hypothetical protein